MLVPAWLSPPVGSLHGACICCVSYMYLRLHPCSLILAIAAALLCPQQATWPLCTEPALGHGSAPLSTADSQPGQSHPADSCRAALAPFRGNRTVGLEKYKWILYGDDDTIWFPDNVLRLVNSLDHTMPYFLTDHIWFPEWKGGARSVLHDQAYQCTLCMPEPCLLFSPMCRAASMSIGLISAQAPDAAQSLRFTIAPFRACLSNGILIPPLCCTFCFWSSCLSPLKRHLWRTSHQTPRLLGFPHPCNPQAA